MRARPLLVLALVAASGLSACTDPGTGTSPTTTPGPSATNPDDSGAEGSVQGWRATVKTACINYGNGRIAIALGTTAPRNQQSEPGTSAEIRDAFNRTADLSEALLAEVTAAKIPAELRTEANAFIQALGNRANADRAAATAVNNGADPAKHPIPNEISRAVRTTAIAAGITDCI